MHGQQHIISDAVTYYIQKVAVITWC